MDSRIAGGVRQGARCGGGRGGIASAAADVAVRQAKQQYAWGFVQRQYAPSAYLRSLGGRVVPFADIQWPRPGPHALAVALLPGTAPKLDQEPKS